MALRDTIKKISSVKGLSVIMLCLAAGILLVFISSTENETDVEVSDEEMFSFLEYREQIENQLEEMLLSMEGISSVKVSVSIDTAYISEYEGSSSRVSTTSAPIVRGVAVVCNDGDDPKVQNEILKMLSALLNIPYSSIYVGSK